MKTDHPILFSAPMVIALLNGRKKQTRRIVKFGMKPNGDTNNYPPINACPHGQPGHRLWVRESISLIDAGCGPCVGQGFGFNVKYEADGFEEWCWATKETLPKSLGKKHSIHMHRWASRLTLEITGVRVERLQDISEADAIAEGARPRFDKDVTEMVNNIPMNPLIGPKEDYRKIWKSINGAASWDANPWVWVIEFNVQKRNIDL